jgi:hypothetical protein
LKKKKKKRRGEGSVFQKAAKSEKSKRVHPGLIKVNSPIKHFSKVFGAYIGFILIPIFIRNTIFAYFLEAGRVALYSDEKGPNARSLGSRAESLIMRETQSIFRRIVLRKGLHDPRRFSSK